MEINIKDLMVNHSWKMSDQEIHNSLVKMGYITDNIDFSSIQMDSMEDKNDWGETIWIIYIKVLIFQTD